MFAKKDIDTPSMVLRPVKNTEEEANALMSKLSRVVLSDLLDDIEVKETIVINVVSVYITSNCSAQKPHESTRISSGSWNYFINSNNIA